MWEAVRDDVMSMSHLSSYVYQVQRGFSSHLLKHSSAVFRSSSTPPPPSMAGRSPPTHSASLRTQPAPDLVLLPEPALLVPRDEGVQKPSPVPQKPKLQSQTLRGYKKEGMFYFEQQLSSPAQSSSPEQVSWASTDPSNKRDKSNMMKSVPSHRMPTFRQQQNISG